MRESNPHPTGPASPITRLLDALDERVFRAADLRAAARGLQVRRPARFRREYRHPGFDHLPPPCGSCDGDGTVDGHDCPDCDGSGRIRARPDEWCRR